MKILPIEKVREADAYTIKHEPVDSIDLMERAAKACSRWMMKNLENTDRIKIFCGLGNNGGDGLAIARLLAKKEYRVEVFILRYSDKSSEDFDINLENLKYQKKVKINEINTKEDLPKALDCEWIVDAIFGSGLSKPVTGFVGDVINYMNRQTSKILAIDIPSGLFADEPSIDSGGAIIEADITLSFEFAKKAFMFAENLPYVKEWEIMPINLHPEFVNSVEKADYLILKQDIVKKIKNREKFDHKGKFGHALLIAGGFGKMGAAVLASEACLRTGAGLLTAHVPREGYRILQVAVPEAMCTIDRSETIFTELPKLDAYNAIGIGPGLGQEKETQNALKMLIQNTNLPILFDADAINILGENKTWLSFLPPGCIFTPHPKEFERLVGKSNNAFERDKLQREFSIKYNAYVVLKGYSTAMSLPDGTVCYNSTGNPGMATGGSGDVLTGVILGLLAQGYTSFEACIVGTYLHGLAGDLASEDLGYEASLASDIIGNIGYAYQALKA
jgi:NAD(P)H-hydrate epimerase